jgi:histidine triad (HIT) family protein
MSRIFCKIISRQLPGYIIAEDENTIVFVALESHPIVAPKEHIRDIFGLNDKLASMIMKTAREVALATKEGLAADGIYITQTNGLAAGQSVFHYHMHVYPKWSDGQRLNRGDESRKERWRKSEFAKADLTGGAIFGAMGKLVRAAPGHLEDKGAHGPGISYVDSAQ